MTNCKKRLLHKLITAIVFVYLLLLFVPPLTVEADRTFLHWVIVLHSIIFGVIACAAFLNWFIETCIAYTECDKKEDERV